MIFAPSNEILNGLTATDKHWDIYHRFYENTFERKSGMPTLSKSFFKEIANRIELKGEQHIAQIILHDQSGGRTEINFSNIEQQITSDNRNPVP